MTTNVTAATWLYFNPHKPGDRMGMASDNPHHFTPLASYEGSEMSSSGLGYISLSLDNKEMLGINFYGSLDMYWSALIDDLPPVLEGEKRSIGFYDLAPGANWLTPLPDGLIRFDRRQYTDSLGDVFAPAVSAVADRTALATAISAGAQAWHDFCERTGETNYAGPIFQERIDAVRAAI